MASLSKIEINGNTYILKDSQARDELNTKISSNSNSEISGIFNFLQGFLLNGIPISTVEDGEDIWINFG
jgi:hypothetical protein